MKVFKNELYISAGETFTLQKQIKNKDGSPYIISNKLNNPYWLITVTDTLYDYPNRYVYNKWLKLKNSLRFYKTKPVDLKSLGYQEWSNLPAGYEGDESAGYANIAVFYLEVNGIKEYKYWKYDNKFVGDYSGRWEKYDCELVTTYQNRITKDWVAQNYYYSISLVSGNETSTGKSPLQNIDLMYPILQPTKIYVRSNLRGGS